MASLKTIKNCFIMIHNPFVVQKEVEYNPITVIVGLYVI